MKPVIAIPSYQRSKRKIFHRISNVNLDVYVFVRPEEVEEYRKAVPERFKIVALKNVTDIGITRNKMMKYLHHKGIEYAFMMDDDCSHVEELKHVTGRKWESNRLLHDPENPPRFEERTMIKWYKLAKKYNMSMSGPTHRFDRSDKGNHIYLNRREVIQCVLVRVPDIIAIGNYLSNKIIGAEDVDMTYRLMNEGYTVGKIGLMEYNVPSIGEGKGGNNAVEESDMIERYNRYVSNFLEYRKPDMDKVRITETKSGIPTIKFVWDNWEGEKKHDY